MVPAPPSPSASPFSEDGILACLARHFPQTHASLLLGRGDDCAVLKAGRPLCVSSDLFLEDIHFRRSYFSPEDTGHKALAVNVSDLAACGARPLGFTLCLGLPDWVDMAWLEAFFSGMAALAGQQRMALAGGDLSRCQQLHISVTVWGETAEPGGFLARGGSMPGDSLFVVGRVGLARVGLHALVTAQNDTFNNTSIIQPFVKNMSNYWTPAENFGKSLVNGEVTHDNAAEMTEKLNTSMNTSAVE